jgi:hypothetical protein
MYFFIDKHLDKLIVKISLGLVIISFFQYLLPLLSVVRPIQDSENVDKIYCARPAVLTVGRCPLAAWQRSVAC